MSLAANDVWRLYALLALASACSMTTAECEVSPYADSEVLFVQFDNDQRFRRGDNPEWSAPEWDDSTWAKATIPGAWQDQGLASVCDTGWYRIRFRLDDTLPGDRLALSLGYVGNASEAFLNGHRLGAIGEFNPIRMPGNLTLHLYPFETDWVNQGENVVAVRVMNIAGAGGILGGPLGLGREGPLRVEAERSRQNRALVLYLITLMTSIALITLSIVLARVRGITWGWPAWVFLVATLGLYVLLILDNHGSPPARLMEGTWILASIATAGITWTITALRRLPPRWLKVTLILTCLSSSLIVVWIGASQSWYAHVSALSAFLFLFCFVATMTSAIASILERSPQALVVAAGSLAIYLGGGVDAFTSTKPLFALAMAPITGWELGLFIVVPSIGYTLICRQIAERQRLYALGKRVFREREDERRRLARDLHDGLGQSLQALKMRLQLDQSVDQSTDAERTPLRQISDCISELRSLAREMHPSVSPGGHLIHAIKAYAAETSSQLDVRIEVRSDNESLGSDWSGDVVAHIYLMCKEAIGNALRHGKASEVIIRVSEEHGLSQIAVQDNGSGFDSDLRRKGGLGLDSMRERAEFIGGKLVVLSDPNQGTTVRIEAPTTSLRQTPTPDDPNP